MVELSQFFNIIDIPGDGNCLYHCIAKSLDISYENVRSSAIYELKRNKSEYIHFLESEFESFDEYCNRHSQDGEWGDNLMIHAISKSLHANISIHSKNKRMPRVDFHTCLKKDAIHLLFYRNHYDLLVPKKWILELNNYTTNQVCKKLLKLYDDDNPEFTEEYILFYYNNIASLSFKIKIQPMIDWLNTAEEEQDQLCGIKNMDYEKVPEWKT